MHTAYAVLLAQVNLIHRIPKLLRTVDNIDNRWIGYLVWSSDNEIHDKIHSAFAAVLVRPSHLQSHGYFGPSQILLTTADSAAVAAKIHPHLSVVIYSRRRHKSTAYKNEIATHPCSDMQY